jgi:hypothetical protein
MAGPFPRVRRAAAEAAYLRLAADPACHGEDADAAADALACARWDGEAEAADAVAALCAALALGPPPSRAAGGGQRAAAAAAAAASRDEGYASLVEAAGY